jgi:hypothetical protein
MSQPLNAPSPLGFAELVRPLAPSEFLATVRDRSPRHFPGDAQRFGSLFSFDEMNRLLGMWRLWTDRTFKLVLDGRDVPPEEFCVSGHGRDGHPALLVDAHRVQALLQRGATVILDVMESLSPGVRELAFALQSALGGTAVCNVYCSFESHAGFPSHYDTTEVFALHIAGVKRWRVYEGRAEQPMDRGGHSYSYQSAEHHEQAKSALLSEVEMHPGDVLYLPRGQYHDALATSGASLHLSFGITRATGLDFMGVLGESLPDDPLFRTELPHFDDREATAAYLDRLAERLAYLVRDPELPAQVTSWQRQRVFRDVAPALEVPQCTPQTRVRVRMGADIRWDGASLSASGEPVALSRAEVAAVDWMLARETFLASELTGACGLGADEARAVLDRLAGAGVVEPV